MTNTQYHSARPRSRSVKEWSGVRSRQHLNCERGHCTNFPLGDKSASGSLHELQNFLEGLLITLHGFHVLRAPGTVRCAVRRLFVHSGIDIEGWERRAYLSLLCPPKSRCIRS